MKLLVVGDYISDEYIFGTATRICPEAPVPVVVPEIERSSPGGVGLVASQLEALGDNEIVAWYGSVSLKHRIFAGNHLVCRIDVDSIEFGADKFPHDDLGEADAVVVCDYDKGAITQYLAAAICVRHCPRFVDAKKNWQWYADANTTIFPNQAEAISLAGEFGCYGRTVFKLGPAGCEMYDGKSPRLQLPATTTNVVDTTGAGDIFMAGFVYAWSINLPAEDCLRFANELAGESCRHVGTYVVPKEFALGVLGRLRASRAPRQQAGWNSLGSILAEQQPRPLQDLVWPDSASGIFDIPQQYWSVDRAAMEATRQRLESARTPPKSPSVPTEQSETRLLSDQESSDEQDRRLR